MVYEQRKVVNQPLAGTSRRGKTSKEEENLELQLLSNEKLVDLGRNDVGKVFNFLIYILKQR